VTETDLLDAIKELQRMRMIKMKEGREKERSENKN